MSSVSGLSEAHRIRARDMAMQAAFLGLEHAPELHYTQGPKRWQGIDNDLKAWRHEYPTQADCSAFATWCLWNGLDHYGVRDVVNAAAWKAGYTGTMLQHGKPVVHEENIMRGDLALYGVPGTTGKHVAICIGGGLVISHGSEGGPYKLPLHYRGDLIVVRRYI
jgi:cell wall-associated NlpC family hydrolase